MESPAIDPSEFRDAQKESWGEAAAGWKKWSGWLDKHAAPVSERLVELARVETGSRVLDIAAGYGEPSLTAARKAGPDGTVVSTDIAPEMLAYGRERAAAAGMENIEFLNSDAISLDFPAESFDAAVSRWGIIFDPDGEGAAARVKGFLKPGPLSRPTPEAIEGLLQGGGFSDVQVEEVDIDFVLGSADEFSTYVREVIAPITRMVEAQPEDVQPNAWKAIADDISTEAAEDGTIRLTNRVLLAAGQA
jgi:enediyne biosynthesis protein CalE5